MSLFSLIPFTRETSPPIAIEVEINTDDEFISISYRVSGAHHLIQLGDPAPNKTRLVKLWEKTCFELFIKNQDNQYIEFNFSPNYEWNCFYFNKAGDSLKEWALMPRPETKIQSNSESFSLFIKIKKEFFPDEFFNRKANFSAGITSVIKDQSGLISYWALSHNDTRPNFHHFDSFKYKF